MKIRTDFVTNSSSSSFVVDIIVETEQDDRYTLYRHLKLRGDALEDAYSYGDYTDDGSYDGALELYYKLQMEVSQGRTYYKGSKIKSIIKRTLVDGFDEGGAEETYELEAKLKAKVEAGEDFEIDPNSVEAFEDFLYDRWDGFLIEEETTTLDGLTSFWYSLDYKLFEFPELKGIKNKNRKNILSAPPGTQLEKDFEKNIPVVELDCRNPNKNYDLELEEVIRDILDYSTRIETVFKDKNYLLQEPQVIKTLIRLNGSSKKGNYWKKVDFSVFNPVRVALYCLSNKIRLINEFSPAAINKAIDIRNKYLTTDKHYLYYSLLNDLPLVSKVKRINGYYGFELDAYLHQEVEEMFLIEREHISSFYKLLRHVNDFEFKSMYDGLHLCCNLDSDYYDDEDEEYEDYDEEYEDYDEEYDDDYEVEEDENEEEYLTESKVSQMHFKIKDFHVEHRSVEVQFNYKYGLNFIMDGVKKDSEGNLLVLCHYGIKPLKEAEVLLLDPNENSAEEIIKEKYLKDFPNHDFDNLIADVFEPYNPNSTLWIDDLSGYDNSPVKMKDVLVEVKFKTGSNKKYLCYQEVGVGSKVKVSGAKSGEVGVVITVSNIVNGHYETVTEVLADDVEIDFTVETTVATKGPKNYFVYKYLWNTKNDSDYGVAIFNEEELTAFWDLDIAMADVLLKKMEMNFEECLYPYEDKLINIFYLTIVRYLIRNYSFDQMIVKNYIDELIQRGWSFAKYKSNILSVISMLIHMRKDNTNLQELYSMIKNMIDKENE